MQFERVTVLVMDGCGAGTAPDSPSFDNVDNVGNTLEHILEYRPNLHTPTLDSLGFRALFNRDSKSELLGWYGRLTETSQGGKDTVTGHWEMMGIRVDQRFPTYPQGFPKTLIQEFEELIGRSVIGNEVASGTDIIRRLGQESMISKSVIVYTSADSVFQIAAHEDIVPPKELYEICLKARKLLQGEHAIQRVIARPFEGVDGAFKRTDRRKDFPLEPPQNVLDTLQEHNIFVSGIGVVPEVFSGRGFNYAKRTQTNEDHYLATLEQLKNQPQGFIFVNFEDFDMRYGHRNDVAGFADAIEVFDDYVASLYKVMGEQDLLLICADHGNDPTTQGTDHSREYSPIFMISKQFEEPRNLDIRTTFADVGATVAHALEVPWSGLGSSLLL